MSQPSPPAGWYADPADAQLLRYWSGSAWTDQTQPSAQVPPPPPQAAFPPPPPQQVGYPPQQVGYPAQQVGYPAQQPVPYLPQARQYPITRYNQRMAARVARRAHLNEPAVAVAFTYNNLATMLIFSFLEDLANIIPSVGDVLEMGLSVLSFYWHRIVIVTDRRVYVYRDWPLHFPGEQLAMFDRGPGLVRMGSDQQGWWSRLIRRGQLTFHDGTVVFHSPWWIRRSQYIAQEGNIPYGQ